MSFAPAYLATNPLPPGIVGALGLGGYQLLVDVAGVGAGRLGSNAFLLVAAEPDPTLPDAGTQISLHQPRLKDEVRSLRLRPAGGPARLFTFIGLPPGARARRPAQQGQPGQPGHRSDRRADPGQGARAPVWWRRERPAAARIRARPPTRGTAAGPSESGTAAAGAPCARATRRVARRRGGGRARRSRTRVGPPRRRHRSAGGARGRKAGPRAVARPAARARRAALIPALMWASLRRRAGKGAASARCGAAGSTRDASTDGADTSTAPSSAAGPAQPWSA